jgi:hypothetical protein
MDSLLIRYWFKSKNGLGPGVTAYSIDDAISILTSSRSAMAYGPNLESYVKNVDIRNLDQNQVILNMGVCSIRGIWFPNVG